MAGTVTALGFEISTLFPFAGTDEASSPAEPSIKFCSRVSVAVGSGSEERLANTHQRTSPRTLVKVASNSEGENFISAAAAAESCLNQAKNAGRAVP